MANILILRFSAIGDVAMTVPVVDSLARQYPKNNYTVVSQSFLSPLFAYCPDNVHFLGVDFQNQYSGIFGIYRLFRVLSNQQFDAVADLHDVLRTKLLRIFFRCSGINVKHIDKGRKEKRRLTRKNNKVVKQLKHTIERYIDVFSALGYPLASLDFRSVFGSSKGDFSRIIQLTGKKSGRWIGIAPFAKHAGKVFPAERTEEVISHFADISDVSVFLFGGGASEQTLLNELEKKYSQTISVAGKLNLSAELVLMSHLDVMFCMDSANMHLASLTATPVISLWGATHPYAGFYGYGQLPENAVQIELSCRPCSIYGNKSCYRKDLECIKKISSQMVISYIETFFC